MIDFHQLDGPFGIPVYFQKLPVNSVSMYWLVFVGSADDETVGQHGIYHWFEHIPSRGTEKYPGGYRDTEARLVRHGGEASAETGYTYTAYSADVPKRVWTEALDILTDMIARPLLRPTDVEAEREVIRQEIDEWHSSPYGEALCKLPSLLWPGHPLGHDQLGTTETLMAMGTDQLHRAHQQGYARSRCVLFLAGNIGDAELQDQVARCAERLPDTQLTERRKSVVHGHLPTWCGGRQTVLETRHEDSAVLLLFPVPSLAEAGDSFLRWEMLEYLITAGDLGSPLNQLVREESQLAYSPDFLSSLNPDGGYWGLTAQTSTNPEFVVETFWKVLKSQQLRSQDWFEYVQDSIRGEFEMHDPCSGDFAECASERLITNGIVWSDAEYQSRLLALTRAQMNDFLDSVTEDLAHAIVFQGKGES